MVEIVAEISGNHSGSLKRACSLIEAAANAGCDYVKFQLYRPEDMPDRLEDHNEEMYRNLMVPVKWLPIMFTLAKQCSIGLFASVFSVRAAKEILEYDVPYIKFAAPKSTRIDYGIYHDIIDIVPQDVDIIGSGDSEGRSAALVSQKILYCPAGYPPRISRGHFEEFRRGNYWGFSDHTPGIRAPLAFIRAGAKMIEKHFKLEGDNVCIDAAFSAEPSTMKLLCKLAHNT